MKRGNRISRAFEAPPARRSSEFEEMKSGKENGRKREKERSDEGKRRLRRKTAGSYEKKGAGNLRPLFCDMIRQRAFEAF